MQRGQSCGVLSKNVDFTFLSRIVLKELTYKDRLYTLPDQSPRDL